ncbi:MAG: FAD-dependent oxidoreductase [Alistipes sp.]
MKQVIIIGGGIAGMQAAVRLSKAGMKPIIIEKEGEIGGKLRGWHHLFPSFTPADQVLSELRGEINRLAIEVLINAEVTAFTAKKVTLADGRSLACDAVIVCTGFTLFDARIKEEYGYGIYDNVFTSADLEQMFNADKVVRTDGSEPHRIAILHCVGSRDEKVCQQHCSRVCCITGVKQAIELKQRYPQADVFNFYMDMRMFGAGYEELYREAQQTYNIHFVRGRVSEASPMLDGRVQIKAEDTLTGRPLRMSVDMLILLVGMRANDSNTTFATQTGLIQASSRFFEPKDLFMHNTESSVSGIFYAGTVTAPKNVGETLNQGAEVAAAVAQYLK